METKIKLLKVGSCKQCERIAKKSGEFKHIDFPMIVGLIKHKEKGNILFDTGYSQHFFECTDKYPNKLYADITPVSLPDDEQIENLLKKEGLSCDDINYVIISHFHADHISGLNLFKKATFICSKEALHDLENNHNLFALKKGYLKDLIPDDFTRRLLLINDFNSKKLNSTLEPFGVGFPFTKDESLSFVYLEGHAKGQIGLIIENEVFFVADACWFDDTYKNLDYPLSITKLFFDNDKEYKRTVNKLNKLYLTNKKIKIIPSHCENSYLLYKDQF